ncbi:MAG: hypothetical protein M1820_009574 [Bogoriella megaspora]|nr:MAG: hypothetical protein M1820_009574 [Bogoriella megaspora]
MPSNTQASNTTRSNSQSNFTPMTTSDASRIQSSQALGGKDMSSGGFAARAQGAGARNEASGLVSGSKGGSQDGGQDK